MLIRKVTFLVLTALLGLLIDLTTVMAQATYPDGFTDELISEDFFAPVGIAFPDSHLIYVWEQHGLIHSLKDGIKLDTPLLDIQAEVSAAGEHGMLGMVLDPNFKNNGYLYVSYVVDPHHLNYFGTPEYDSTDTDSWNATIGRVARFQVNVTSFTEVIPGSRKVLLGSEPSNGIPVLAPSHGVGGLDFGTDGTLLVGSGDGTTWVGHHTGGEEYQEFGYDSLGKAIGIIDQLQDVGSLRAQQIESYSGKILRIDPATGFGLPSNPFYDATAPDAAQSKVWAMGLRSPFRIRVRPSSGSIDPGDGRPGVIYIGDVGSNQYEELNIAGEAGKNFGWPLYEGMEINRGFWDQWVENPYAINTQTQHCEIDFYRFNDLLVPPSKDHSLNSVHPCNTNADIQKDHPVFIHERPAFSYGNTKNNPEQTYVASFSAEGKPTAHQVSDPRSSIAALPFDGISSIAGDFYMGQRFPKSYHQVYFHADHSGWIKAMEYDTHNIDEIHTIRSFKEGGLYIVYIRYNPFDQAFYYVVIDYSTKPTIYQIRKVFYGGNAKPIANITANVSYGTAPLTVNISAVSSFDPAGEPLTYFWSGPNLKSQRRDTILILLSSDDTPQNDTIRLTVIDSTGLKDSTYQIISLNNTPPEVEITSISEGNQYPLDQGLVETPLQADVHDIEHENDQLSYYWEIKLKHNDHFHLEHIDTNVSAVVTLFPLGSTALDEHSYLIELTVTDPLGLSSFDEVTIQPDLTTHLGTILSNEQILTYPNPVLDHLNIDITSTLKSAPYSVTLYDLSGKVYLSETFQSNRLSSHHDLQKLPAGLYILLLTSKNEIMDIRKIIKE
ncbi:MAG: T9SS type A sorting domain-containing protein [Saprospiraceae bacterium]|nr:T9SS type A sorting domain-containing protein [Saprospiraceae bacterium]